MMSKFIHGLISFFSVTTVMFAQTSDSLTDELPPNLEYIVEEFSGNFEENMDASDILYENNSGIFTRVDLNTSDSFELAEKLQLNPTQIQHLTNYIQKYGPLLTIYELNAIQGFDGTTIQRMLPLIRVQSPEEKTSLNPVVLMRQMRGTLLLRYGRILEPQAGFLPAEDTAGTKEKYLGDPSKILVRCNMKAANRINLGLVAEKDAGEQLFKGTQKQGFDHYAAYLMVMVNKVLKSVIIGDYHLGFGQGLTISTSGMMTSSRGLYQPYKFPNPTRPNTSSNESTGLRGMAANIKTGKIGWTIFFSQKKLDARVNVEDSLDQVVGTQSLITSGYHRTLEEMNKKNGVQSLMYGGHATYNNHFLQVGITGFHNLYHPAFLRSDELYKRFLNPGGKMTLLGFDFRLLLPHVMFFGEMTYRIGQDAALIAGMSWYTHPRFKHTSVYYHYPFGFYNPLSSALGKHQPNYNEKGWSWSFEALISRTLTCSGGANVFWFPWISYRLDKPCSGSEFYFLSSYKPSSHTLCTLRFIYKTGLQNITNIQEAIKPSRDLSSYLLSAQCNQGLSPGFTLKSQLYVSLSRTGGVSEQPGYLISADLQYKPVHRPLEMVMRYALFDTESYSNRIYAYERDVLYAFSAPAYYSKGTRIYAMIRYALWECLDIWLRYSRTLYIDQSTTGSGLDEIRTSHKSDIKIQVRIRF